MFVLRRLPALLALLMLGALSMRLGWAFPMAASLTLILLVLLFIPRNPVQAALSVVLWAGALAWAAMAWMRVQQRLSEGLPWARLAAILIGVALFTAWAAWMVRERKT